MEYIGMKSPNWFTDYKIMSNKEAKKFFEWYISMIDSRVKYLQNFISNEGIECVLDYSSESLIPLWEWFKTKIVLVEKDNDCIELEKRNTPKWMWQYIERKQFSDETDAITVDIAMYFGEVVRMTKSDIIYWDYVKNTPKNVSYHHPVLRGFKGNDTLDPQLITNVATWSVIRKRQRNGLYEVYCVWKNAIAATD